MAGFLWKRKEDRKIAMPPIPPLPPVPKPEDTDEAAERAAMLAKQRAGFRKTIITGALEPEPRGKTLLGG